MVGVQELIVSGTTFPTFNGTTTPARTTLADEITLGANATLTGDLAIQKRLYIGGKTLTVGGDLYVETSAGYLQMNSSADRVTVNGGASFAGGDMSDDFLAEGILDVKGSFTQSSTNSSRSFVADNNHTTKLSGASGQTVSFASMQSHFRDLQITNTSSGGVTIGGSAAATVGGLLALKANGVLTIGSGKTLALSNATPAFDIYSGAAIHLNGSVTPISVSCRRHDPTTAGSLGTAPTLDGTGLFGGTGSAILSAVCSAADLR
jgi:hypothetical protein